MLGPGEFFQGLALGGQQFFAGTIGKRVILSVYKNECKQIMTQLILLHIYYQF